MTPVVNASTAGGLEPFSNRALLNGNLLPDLLDLSGGDGGDGDDGQVGGRTSNVKPEPSFLEGIPFAGVHSVDGSCISGLCTAQLPPLSISFICNRQQP